MERSQSQENQAKFEKAMRSLMDLTKKVKNLEDSCFSSEINSNLISKNSGDVMKEAIMIHLILNEENWQDELRSLMQETIRSVELDCKLPRIPHGL